ncbi:MAG: hypothetical protein ACFFBI_00390 [Promethearchaeota archaeon]
MIISSLVIHLDTIITPRDIKQNSEYNLNVSQNIEEYEENREQHVASGQRSNYEIIDEVFSQTLNQYSSSGYFTQKFEPSLQATYFALYILDVLNRLDLINQTAISNYIMSQYDVDSHIFMDNYGKRYLNMNLSQYYYAYTSLLEVNCYATLALDILGQRGSINTQGLIDFIWSCHNPITSGFIGQPYNALLEDKRKVSTMQNTYFAIKTLDVLMGNWVGFSNEKNELIQYIISLQITDDTNSLFGSFNNDNTSTIKSLSPLYEPNLLSAYYCIKSLEIFGMEGSINYESFNQFLDGLYDPAIHYFKMGQDVFSVYGNFTNIVASALGLDLSDITGFLSINPSAVVNFILNNKNNFGIWDQSTRVNIHELMDIFQIIRSLKESGKLNSISSQDKNTIATTIKMYQQHQGYSLLSEDYTSINLLYSIINSFNLFGRTSDLDIDELYRIIKECNTYRGSYYGFYGSINLDDEYFGFRSHPIEYYTSKDGLTNHKITFMALNALQSMFKLNNFGLAYNLNKMVNDILNSQFLDPEFDNYGAFLPSKQMTLMTPKMQNQYIFFEHNYYAIKALEILAEHLELGNIVELNFNKGALYSYILRNINQTNGIIQFNPDGVKNVETLMQHTYYMIYILKALNLFDLNKNNFSQFILQNIDYGNIKSVYYSYKIDEILDLEINFDVNLTCSLIGKLYSERYSEFYESIERDKINQEIFYWICDMARNSDLSIECHYKKSLSLGSVNTISAYFSNLVFLEYGDATSVIFESPQFGILELEKQFDNSYQISFMVPEEARCYPSVEGSLKIYDNFKLIGQVPIFFQTSMVQKIVRSPIVIDETNLEFHVNISRKFSSEFQPVHNSTVKFQIYLNNTPFGTINLRGRDYTNLTSFRCDYLCMWKGNYHSVVTLFDDFFPNGLLIFTYDFERGIYKPPRLPEPLGASRWILGVGGVIINTLLVVGIVKGGRWIKKKLKKDVKTDQKCSVIEDFEQDQFGKWQD